jgi:ABC-type polar amino acid transport system ATPase subunit
MLTLSNITKQYGRTEVLKSINLTVSKGEVVSIIGPSGAGKTTLLRCVALLEDFDNGKIVFDNRLEINKATTEEERAKQRKRVGVVFQDFHLWPHKNVLGNVIEALGLVKHLSQNEAEERAKEWLKKVDLLDKINEYPDNLSGGQKQRVAIARTLAIDPEIILFDEITAALDPVLAMEVLRIIKRLAKDGRTMIVATHHMKFAREISDRTVFIEKGEIIEEGVTESIFENPRREETRKFLSGTYDNKQEINIYEGYEDFQAYHLGLIKRVRRGAIGYVVGAVGDKWFGCMGDAYPEYEKLFRGKGITWKWISFRLEDFEKEIMKKLGGQLQIKLIPKEYATPANFNIWEDSIVLQTFGEPPAVIEIKNKNLVGGYANYFNLLWEIGKEIKI